ncbi:hypothetical protein HMPREF0765_4788 [Sphingobacterium spiritivorum ATCC 33300]|uniref:Uncharacterized protein n=1 Tax=Sphingobacterium spiritivorum ATCC 33300 TaxID=525372 RepID=C2G5D2_SPHSI|nr:hypothetical protein HMPREF0765_4788 [Sphingobacterium spiritivorum ATCC 33300]
MLNYLIRNNYAYETTKIHSSKNSDPDPIILSELSNNALYS